jgi:hypothetical protein
MPRSALARRSVTHFLVPALLVAVAARQLYLSHTQRLSPWKGGGFGMFASVDLPQYRVVRAYLLTPTGEVPAELGGLPRVATLVGRVRAMPGPGHVDALADALLGLRWALDTTAAASDARVRASSGSRPAAGEGDHLAPASLHVSRVRVEVWRIDFDGINRRLRLAKLAERTRARS